MQIISGQRCVTKREAVEKFVDILNVNEFVDSSHIHIFDLDDLLTRLDFEEDFTSFKVQIETSLETSIESLTHPVYLIFKQVENATHLFPYIAKLRMKNPEKLKILLTSSINLEANIDYRKYFIEEVDIHRIYPPTLRDVIQSKRIRLPDSSIIEAIAKGKIDLHYFSESAEHMKNHSEEIRKIITDFLLFGGNYLMNRVGQPVRTRLKDYYENILVSVYQLTELKKFDQILRILTLQNGNILNLLKMCDTHNINRNTMRKYSGILMDTYMIDYVHPFLKAQVDKPIMRSPKLYFYDNGLVNYLNGIRTFQILENTHNFQSNLDGMLYLNLKAIIADMGINEDIKFLRDYQNHELDFLLSTDNGLVPVGICMDSETRKEKIKTFRYYLRYCQQIYHGIIFDNQDEIECIDMKKSKLYILPIWMMW